jgi:hypothetical protein
VLEWEVDSTRSQEEGVEEERVDSQLASRSEVLQDHQEDSVDSLQVTRTISSRVSSVVWEGWEGCQIWEGLRGEREPEEEVETLSLRWVAEEVDSREGSAAWAWTSTTIKTCTVDLQRRSHLQKSVSLLPAFLAPIRAAETDSSLLPPAKPLPISLEDIYKGTTKKLKVTKKLMSGREESNVLEINVKAGWKAGTKVRFAGAGSETPSGAQDMVFVIEEKPHATFKREGDDLIYTLQVPLVDALSGPDGGGTPARSLTHLDGRTINFNVPYPRGGGAPLKPGQVIRVANEVSAHDVPSAESLVQSTDALVLCFVGYADHSQERTKTKRRPLDQARHQVPGPDHIEPSRRSSKDPVLDQPLDNRLSRLSFGAHFARVGRHTSLHIIRSLFRRRIAT